MTRTKKIVVLCSFFFSSISVIVALVLVWYYKIREQVDLDPANTNANADIKEQETRRTTTCPAQNGFPATEIGGHATVACPTGFTGSKKATCGADGTFTLPDSSSCVPVISECPASNGFPTTKVGLVASAPCVNAKGNKIALCKANGTFAAADTSLCKQEATLYEHAEYMGRSWTITPGGYDWDTIDAHLGRDTISSVKVQKGCTVTLFEDHAYNGPAKVIHEDTTWISDFNDRATSLNFTCP
jgi:hypothetical protein